ncbi:MAG TPA: hypothetical protein VHB68_17480, partial [Steroidobacteraceae bacterium]|nr:hypothetical protein [Steroidobacteraceae bacterium]
MRSTQLRRRWAARLVAASLAASVSGSFAADAYAAEVPSPYTAGCDTRVIVAFTDEAIHPDDVFLADLGKATGVRLSLVRLLGRNQFLFWASGSPNDAGCQPVLARLRHDPRIRSA